MAHRLHGLAVIVDRLRGIPNKIPHGCAGDGARFHAARRGGCPLIRIIGWLVQYDPRRPRRAGDDAERLAQSGRRIIGRGIERGEKL